MHAGASAEVPVTFEDIAIYFSQEEWEDLEELKKELYKDVMQENYKILISLETGSPTATPDIISHIDQGEEPYIRDEPGSEERETGTSSCSENENHKNNATVTQHWQLRESPRGNKILSEREWEDRSSCSDWGRNCRPQYISEKKQRNSTRDSSDTSACEQSGSHRTYIEEKSLVITISQN